MLVDLFLSLNDKLNSLWNVALLPRVALVLLVCRQKTFTCLISLSNGPDGIG